MAGIPGGSRNLSTGSNPYGETEEPKLFCIKLTSTYTLIPLTKLLKCAMDSES